MVEKPSAPPTVLSPLFTSFSMRLSSLAQHVPCKRRSLSTLRRTQMPDKKPTRPPATSRVSAVYHSVIGALPRGLRRDDGVESRIRGDLIGVCHCTEIRL